LSGKPFSGKTVIELSTEKTVINELLFYEALLDILSKVINVNWQIADGPCVKAFKGALPCVCSDGREISSAEALPSPVLRHIHKYVGVPFCLRERLSRQRI
jgi:DNA primase catalytic subunit